MLVLGYKRKNSEGAQEQKGNTSIILCAEGMCGEVSVLCSLRADSSCNACCIQQGFLKKFITSI